MQLKSRNQRRFCEKPLLGGEQTGCVHGDEFGVEILSCFTSSCLKDQQGLDSCAMALQVFPEYHQMIRWWYMYVHIFISASHFGGNLYMVGVVGVF